MADSVDHAGVQRGIDNVIRDGKRGWLMVFAAFMNSFLIDGMSLSFGMIRPLLEEYLPPMVRTSFAIYWIGALQISAQMILAPITSMLLERFGMRYVAMAGGLLSACCYMVCFFAAPNIWIFYIFYGIIGGYGHGMTYVTGIITVNEYFNEKRQLAVGVTVSGTGLGICVMGFTMQALVNCYSWHGMIFILAAFSIQTIFFSCLLPRSRPVKKKHLRNCLYFSKKICGNPWLFLYYLSGFLFSLSITLPYYYTPMRVINTYNFNEIQAGRIISSIGIGSLFGRISVALVGIFKCISKERIWLFVSSLLVCGIVNVISSTFVSYDHWIVWGAIVGFTSGSIIALSTIILKDMTSDEFTIAYGSYLLARGLAMLIGPPLAGLLYDTLKSYDLIFYILGLFFILSGVVVMPIHRFNFLKLLERFFLT